MAERRDKGLGSVTQLSNGKYKITFTVGYDLDNKQIRKSFTAKTKRECLEKMKAYNGENITTKNILFKSYAEKILAIKKLSLKNSSIITYNTAVNALCGYLGDIALNKITQDKIATTLSSMSDKYSTPTMRTNRAILKHILDKAFQEDLIKKPLTIPSVRRVTERTISVTLPSENEVKKILDVAYDYSLEARSKSAKVVMYEYFLLALATGMRRGELLALKWKSIDFKKNTIRIESNMSKVTAGRYKEGETKNTASLRTIAVDKAVLNQLTKNDSDYVFSWRNKPINAHNISMYAKEILVRANFPFLHLHDLRHIHATILLRHGVNIKIISRRLGHADITTTLKTYAHYIPELDECASSILGENLVLKKCL